MTSPGEPMKACYAARAPYCDDVYGKPERREDIAFLRDHLPAAAAMTATDAVAEPLDLARGRPARDDLETLVAPLGTRPDHRALQNFWLFSYEAAGSA